MAKEVKDTSGGRRTIGCPATSTGKGNVAQDGGFCDGSPRSGGKEKEKK